MENNQATKKQYTGLFMNGVLTDQKDLDKIKALHHEVMTEDQRVSAVTDILTNWYRDNLVKLPIGECCEFDADKVPKYLVYDREWTITPKLDITHYPTQNGQDIGHYDINHEFTLSQVPSNFTGLVVVTLMDITDPALMSSEDIDNYVVTHGWLPRSKDASIGENNTKTPAGITDVNDPDVIQTYSTDGSTEFFKLSKPSDDATEDETIMELHTPDGKKGLYKVTNLRLKSDPVPCLVGDVQHTDEANKVDEMIKDFCISFPPQINPCFVNDKKPYKETITADGKSSNNTEVKGFHLKNATKKELSSPVCFYVKGKPDTGRTLRHIEVMSELFTGYSIESFIKEAQKIINKRFFINASGNDNCPEIIATSSNTWMIQPVHFGIETLPDNFSGIVCLPPVNASPVWVGDFNETIKPSTDEWLSKAIQDPNAVGDDADRDYFNVWTQGGDKNRFLLKEELKQKMIEMKTSITDIFSKLFNEVLGDTFENFKNCNQKEQFNFLLPMIESGDLTYIQVYNCLKAVNGDKFVHYETSDYITISLRGTVFDPDDGSVYPVSEVDLTGWIIKHPEDFVEMPPFYSGADTKNVQQEIADHVGLDVGLVFPTPNTEFTESQLTYADSELRDKLQEPEQEPTHIFDQDINATVDTLAQGSLKEETNLFNLIANAGDQLSHGIDMMFPRVSESEKVTEQPLQKLECFDMVAIANGVCDSLAQSANKDSLEEAHYLGENQVTDTDETSS